MTITIGAGRYQLGDRLGVGGMGTVYEGVDTETNQTVAIKHLKPQVAQPEHIERFQREGQALRDLNHPNIVDMLDSLHEDDQHYLVMEYVAGGDLSQLLKEGRLPVKQLLNLSIDLADALTRAHRLDIIHRDLKPANVLIAEDGTLRLTDFGVAQVGGKERVTNDDAIVGTVDYMPPEAFDTGTIDARSDIWAFGVMLYEMLVGERPFKGESLMQIIQAILHDPVPDIEEFAPDAPIALIDLIYRMLDRDPRQRIPSVRIVGAELEALLKGHDTGTINVTKPVAAPAPETTVTMMHNLPAQPTPFVGREAELDELAALLGDVKIRMVTVLAPGGMGKTRLALEAAEKNLEGFADGVYFVELAPLSDAGNIITEIASALNIQIQGNPQKQVLNYLQAKNLLLVLDNWEHLLDGATLVSEILKAAPDVKILNTSRVRLGQMGETLFHLSGMDFPQWETPADALEYAAVKLFMNSALRAQPSFELTVENLDYVARICRLVQGLPLGIVLAAAWLSLLSPEEIADELQQGMDILADELGELPERQQSIRVVMDYAWQSMTEAEQQVFMKLVVFRGGFTREAAQAVTGANLRLLMSLVNKSLIRRDNATGRYEIHELLRQFGEEQLTQSGDFDNAMGAHLAYFKQFTSERLDLIKGSKQQFDVVAEIKREIENIHQAWFFASELGQVSVMRAMLEMLHHFHFDFGNYLGGINFYARAIAEFPVEQDVNHTYMMLKIHYAELLASVGQAHNGVAYAEEGLAYASQYPDDLQLNYFALKTRARSYSAVGDIDAAFQIVKSSESVVKKMNEPWYWHDMYQGRALLLSIKGVEHQEEMLAALKAALAAAEQINNINSIGSISSNISAVAFAMGNWDEAEGLVRGNLKLAQDMSLPIPLAIETYKLARLNCIKGHFDEAQTSAEWVLNHSLKIQAYLWACASTTLFAMMAEAQGEYSTARTYAQQALDYALKTDAWAFQEGVRIRRIWMDLFDNPTTVDLDAVIATIPYGLNNYQLTQRMDTVIVIAKMKQLDGDYNSVAELLATVLEHPKCPPYYQLHQPLAYIRDNAKEQLGEEAFDAAWQRGAALEFGVVVAQLKEEYAEDTAND